MFSLSNAEAYQKKKFQKVQGIQKIKINDFNKKGQIYDLKC